jgi:hypothetical protein
MKRRRPDVLDGIKAIFRSIWRSIATAAGVTLAVAGIIVVCLGVALALPVIVALFAAFVIFVLVIGLIFAGVAALARRL